MSSKPNKNLSRRQFLKAAATATAATQLTAWVPSAFAKGLLAPTNQDGTVAVWGWPTQITRSFDAEGNDMLTERVLDEAGVTVEMNLVDQPDLGPRLRAALPAGTGPDVIATDFDVMSPYWQFMASLNDLAEADWGPDWKTTMFSPTAVTEMDLVSEMAGRPGEVLYIPGNMQLLGWPYYWISDFADNDIDAASLKTFDDFKAACEKLKAAGIIPMFGSSHPAELADWFKELAEVAAPGKMELVQRGEAKFTDSDMVETFNLIALIYNNYLQPGAIGADAGDAMQSFFNHEGSMIYTFAGTPYFGLLNNDSQIVRDAMRNSWGTFQFPGGKGLAATDAGMAIVDNSQNKQAAWEFVKWVTTGQGAEYDARDAASPFGAAAIQPSETGTDFDKNLAQPLFEALQSGDNVFRRILCPDVYSAITTTIPGVVTGQLSAEDAAAEVQSAFDQNCGQWVS